jgi:carboxypeptidase Taq
MLLKNQKIKKLTEFYREISLLGKIGSILQWDMNVNLPVKGAGGRALQSAYITKLVTEKWQDKEFKELLDEVDGSDNKLSVEEKAILRNLKHSSKFYYKVPKDVIIEFSEATSKAFMVWQMAKHDNKYKVFLPHLKKVINLIRSLQTIWATKTINTMHFLTYMSQG